MQLGSLWEHLLNNMNELIFQDGLKTDSISSKAISGDISFNDCGITDLKDPVLAQDAVTKAYVDTLTEDYNPRKNVILNSDFCVSQLGTTFTSVATGTTIMDRWVHAQANTTTVVDISQSSDVPTVAESGVYFRNSIKYLTTTHDAGVGDTEYITLSTRINGTRYDLIRNQSCTLSFWWKSSRLGNFLPIVLKDASNSVYFSHTFTMAPADQDVWKKYSVTIPAPAIGTWNKGDGLCALQVIFTLRCGTDLVGGTVDEWNSGDVLSSDAIGAFGDSASQTAYITGVQLEAGNAVRPYTVENYSAVLNECYRHMFRLSVIDTSGLIGMATIMSGTPTTRTAYVMVYLPVSMVKIPTLSTSAANTFQLLSYSGGTATIGANTTPVLHMDTFTNQLCIKIVVDSSSDTIWGVDKTVQAIMIGAAPYLLFKAEI